MYCGMGHWCWCCAAVEGWVAGDMAGVVNGVLRMFDMGLTCVGGSKFMVEGLGGAGGAYVVVS